MARNNHNDWTDELREMIDGVELPPSEGGWERLKADLHPRKAVWWPYAVPAAACLLLGGVFLFRGRPSENVFDVASSEPSAMVADVAAPAAGVPEDVCFADPTASGPPSYDAAAPREIPLGGAGGWTGAGGTGTVSGTPAARSNILVATVQNALEMTSGSSSAAGETGALAMVETPSCLSGSAELVNGNGDTDSLTTAEVSDASITAEGVPDGPRPVVEEEPALPSLAVMAPSFDIEDEPIARKRGQRRKITVTVSAGGAFGAAGNGMYIAQASTMTKAGDGAVMDITEVIQHSTPVQKALGLSIPISDKLDIATGIDHMELNSVVGFGNQNLEWIGVPLRLGYRIADWGASSINLGAGVKGEKCLSATLLGMDYNEQFQWAANMGADYRVRVFGPVSLSLTPELSYYFTDTVLPTYRTDHPLTFTLRAGLSLNL